MSRSPAQVRLTVEEEATLRAWTREGTSEQRLVERAKIILLSHEGVTVENIARQLDTRPARVSKWRSGSRRTGLAPFPTLLVPASREPMAAKLKCAC